MRVTLVATPLALILAASTPGLARTFEVVSGLDAGDGLPGDGTCESTLGDRACTLRAAVQEANAWPGRDVILLPAGRFGLGIEGHDEDAAATGDLDVLEDLELRGEDRLLTVIDANALDRALDVRGAGAHLELFNLTVMGGCAVGDGGAIHAARDARVSLYRVTLEGNSATGHGGGLSARDLGIYRSLIRFNESGASGGGVRALGDLHVWWSTIADNASVTGPAVATGRPAPAPPGRSIVIGCSHVREDRVARAVMAWRAGAGCPPELLAAAR